MGQGPLAQIAAGCALEGGEWNGTDRPMAMDISVSRRWLPACDSVLQIADIAGFGCTQKGDLRSGNLELENPDPTQKVTIQMTVLARRTPKQARCQMPTSPVPAAPLGRDKGFLG